MLSGGSRARDTRGGDGAAGEHELRTLLAARLLEESCGTLHRLRHVRGASHRTARRIAQATAALTLALGLLGVLPAPQAAKAFTMPMFGSAQQNPFGLAKVSGESYPELVDLDDDGDLDAIVGQFLGNQWQYFQNTGSATAPAFAAPVGNPFGLTNSNSRATPALADLDNDGDVDFLSGGDDGNLRYYENTGTASAPAFAAAVSNPFGLTNAGTGSFPEFADIDGDGDVDLFVGTVPDVAYYQNTGTASAPAFAAKVLNPFGIALGMGRQQVALADLDGDGDLDLYNGPLSGDTVLYENTGSATMPAFSATGVTNPFGLSDIGFIAAPEFADLDGDGDLDAFHGSGAGDLYFFENTCPTPTITASTTATASATPTPTTTATGTATATASATSTPVASSTASATATATATPLLPDGATCGAPDACASGNCADGVCCDQPCDGPEQQCNLPGREGTCASSAAPAPAASPIALLAGFGGLLAIAARRLWRRR